MIKEEIGKKIKEVQNSPIAQIRLTPQAYYNFFESDGTVKAKLDDKSSQAFNHQIEKRKNPIECWSINITTKIEDSFSVGVQLEDVEERGNKREFISTSHIYQNTHMEALCQSIELVERRDPADFKLKERLLVLAFNNNDLYNMDRLLTKKLEQYFSYGIIYKANASAFDVSNTDKLYSFLRVLNKLTPFSDEVKNDIGMFLIKHNLEESKKFGKYVFEKDLTAKEKNIVAELKAIANPNVQVTFGKK